MTHPNIVRSMFKVGEYVGYDARGYPWRVFKVGYRKWVARPGASHPCRDTAPTLRDVTLAAMAQRLSERGAKVTTSA